MHAGIRGGLCVSVPSFGDSFFIKDMLEDEAISLEKVFPSPYSGILFLWKHRNVNRFSKLAFPSPYSGILFLCIVLKPERKRIYIVSVPLFGDSFFMI